MGKGSKGNSRQLSPTNDRLHFETHGEIVKSTRSSRYVQSMSVLRPTGSMEEEVLPI